MSVHERLQERMRSVVERFMIGMAGDAVCVKSNYGVDSRLRCLLGRDRDHVRGEGGGEQIGD